MMRSVKRGKELLSTFVAKMSPTRARHVKATFGSFNTRRTSGTDLSMFLHPLERGGIMRLGIRVYGNPRIFLFALFLDFVRSHEVPLTELNDQDGIAFLVMISVLDLAKTQLTPSNATHITIDVEIGRFGTAPSHISFGIASSREASRQRPARRFLDVLVPTTDFIHVRVGKQLFGASNDLHGSPTG